MNTAVPVRILYVDDDPVLARLAVRVLARDNFELVHAHSISAGLELFAGGSFKAVVLDHYFQGQTGLDFLEAIKGKRANIPVLYVTGSADAEIAIKAIKGGAADYVMKSATDDFFPLLVSALNQALENARLREEKAEADRQVLLGKEHAEMLLAEMNHRIANSLAMASAMIRMQIQIAHSDETKTALGETQSRIMAIAGVHRSLYTSKNVEQVELDVYLGSLNAELKNSNSAFSRVSLEVDITPMLTTADKAVALGVILTELVTNALKYAYPSGEGIVKITLAPVGNDEALLSVEDFGIGYDPSEMPKGTGLGSRLVRSMAINLEADLSHVRQGKSVGTYIAVRWPR